MPSKITGNIGGESKKLLQDLLSKVEGQSSSIEQDLVFKPKIALENKDVKKYVDGFKRAIDTYAKKMNKNVEGLKPSEASGFIKSYFSLLEVQSRFGKSFTDTYGDVTADYKKFFDNIKDFITGTDKEIINFVQSTVKSLEKEAKASIDAIISEAEAKSIKAQQKAAKEQKKSEQRSAISEAEDILEGTKSEKTKQTANDAKKAMESTQAEATETQEQMGKVGEASSQAQERVVRDQQVIQKEIDETNAAIEKQRQVLKSIEEQQRRNEAKGSQIKDDPYGYFGFDDKTKPIYDLKKLRDASNRLGKFDLQLPKRSEFSNKAKELFDIIEKDFISQYGIENGAYKDLADFMKNRPDLKYLYNLFQNGIKGEKTKDIENAFRTVISNLKSSGALTAEVLGNNNAYGLNMFDELEKAQIEVGETRQRLFDEEQAQLHIINELQSKRLKLLEELSAVQRNSSTQTNQDKKSYTEIVKQQIEDVQKRIEQTKNGIKVVDEKGIFAKYLLGENGDIKSSTQLSSEIQAEIDKVNKKFSDDYNKKGILHSGEEYIKKLEQTFRKIRASHAFGLFDPKDLRDDIGQYYDQWRSKYNRWLQSSNSLNDDAWSHYSILIQLQEQLNNMQRNGGKDYIQFLEEAQKMHEQINAAKERNATFKEEDFDQLDITQEEADKRAAALRDEQKALDELTTSTREYIQANKEFNFEESPLYHDDNIISGLETMSKMLDREASRYENYTRNKRNAERAAFSDATDKMLGSKTGVTKEIESEWDKLETAILEGKMKGSEAIEAFENKTKELGFSFNEAAQKWEKIQSSTDETSSIVKEAYSKWGQEVEALDNKYKGLGQRVEELIPLIRTLNGLNSGMYDVYNSEKAEDILENKELLNKFAQSMPKSQKDIKEFITQIVKGKDTEKKEILGALAQWLGNNGDTASELRFNSIDQNAFSIFKSKSSKEKMLTFSKVIDSFIQEWQQEEAQIKETQRNIVSIIKDLSKATGKNFDDIDAWSAASDIFNHRTKRLKNGEGESWLKEFFQHNEALDRKRYGFVDIAEYNTIDKIEGKVSELKSEYERLSAAVVEAHERFIQDSSTEEEYQNYLKLQDELENTVHQMVGYETLLKRIKSLQQESQNSSSPLPKSVEAFNAWHKRMQDFQFSDDMSPWIPMDGGQAEKGAYNNVKKELNTMADEVLRLQKEYDEFDSTRPIRELEKIEEELRDAEVRFAGTYSAANQFFNEALDKSGKNGGASKKVQDLFGYIMGGNSFDENGAWGRNSKLLENRATTIEDKIQQIFKSLNTNQISSQNLFTWIEKNGTSAEKEIFRINDGIEEFRKVLRGLSSTSGGVFSFSETLGMDNVTLNNSISSAKRAVDLMNEIEDWGRNNVNSQLYPPTVMYADTLDELDKVIEKLKEYKSQLEDIQKTDDGTLSQPRKDEITSSLNWLDTLIKSTEKQIEIKKKLDAQTRPNEPLSGDDAIVQYITEMEQLEKQSNETREAIERAIAQTYDAESAGSSLDLLAALHDENIVPEDITGNLDKVLEKIRALGLSTDDLKKAIKLLKGDTAHFSWINSKGLDQEDKIRSLIQLLKDYGLQVKEITNADAFNTEIITQTKAQAEAARQTAAATGEAAKGMDKEGESAVRNAKKKGKFTKANKEVAQSAKETEASSEGAAEGMNDEGEAADKVSEKIKGYLRNQKGDASSGDFSYTEAINKVVNKSVRHITDNDGNHWIEENYTVDYDKLTKEIIKADTEILDLQNKISKATDAEKGPLNENLGLVKNRLSVYEELLSDMIQSPKYAISDSQRQTLIAQRALNEEMIRNNQLAQDAAKTEAEKKRLAKERQDWEKKLNKEMEADRKAMLAAEEADAKLRAKNQQALDKETVKNRQDMLASEEADARMRAKNQQVLDRETVNNRQAMLKAEEADAKKRAKDQEILNKQMINDRESLLKAEEDDARQLAKERQILEEQMVSNRDAMLKAEQNDDKTRAEVLEEEYKIRQKIAELYDKQYKKQQSDYAKNMTRSEKDDASLQNARVAASYKDLQDQLLEYIKLRQKASDGDLSDYEQERLQKLTSEYEKARNGIDEYSINMLDAEKNTKRLTQAQEELRSILSAIENNTNNENLYNLGIKARSQVLRSYGSFNNLNADSYVGEVKDDILRVQEILKEISTKGLDLKNQDSIRFLNEIEERTKRINSQKSLNSVKAASMASIKEIQAQIRAFEANNTAMGKDFMNRFDSLWNEFEIASTIEQVDKLRGKFADLKGEVDKAGKTGNSFWTSFKKQLKSANAQLLATYFSWRDWIRYIRTAYTTIKELDDALLDLKKTTTMNNSDLEEFYKNAGNIAKEMGVSSKEILSQASAWSRLGFGSKEAAETMAQLSSKFASISPGMNTDEAQTGLVSLIKAWNVDVKDVERELMDNINTLGNKFALSNKDIIEGMERAGATLSVIGTSVQDSFALFTGAQEVIQNAETVGTALKTLSLRIRGKYSLPPYTEMYTLCS